jgi:UDP:flavonoid glycosyltransferase YjiC (YdhE family)
MKFFITSIGTRGDIEPFLAIGEILSNRGHVVAYAFSKQFGDIISPGALFYPISAEILELINSAEGRTVMGKAGVFKKIKALFVLYKKGKTINQDIALEHQKAIDDFEPDVIIHNPKCSYPVVWSLQTGKDNIIVSPVPYVMYPVKNHPHVGINKNLGQVLNKLSYKLSNFGLIKTIYDVQKLLRIRDKYSKQEIKKAVFKSKLIFSITPQLFKRPNYWPENVQILGHHERNKIIDWTPNTEIIDFLKAHSKILFLSFGSMYNSSPQEISEIFYAVIHKLKIPCIVNTASGGLMPIEKYKSDDKFLFMEQIPYEWIFKRVYGVIHHGGSGTTQMALKNGLASLIIPHIIDQYGWNNLIHKNGFGPKGISINNISSRRLIKLISSLYQESRFKLEAEKIAEKMNGNDLETELHDFIMH